MSEQILSSELLKICINAVGNGAEMIRTVRNISEWNDNLVDKGNGIDFYTGNSTTDFQTDADIKSEIVIKKTILNSYPSIKIVSEENTNMNDEPISNKDYGMGLFQRNDFNNNQLLDLNDIILYIDPMDGTKEFVSGNLECVTVLIGISLSGKSIGGVMYRVYPDENYPYTYVAGIHNFGIWCDGIPLQPIFPENTTIINSIAVGSKEHPVIKRTIDLINPSIKLKYGANLKMFLMLTTNSPDAIVYCRPGPMKWDICPIDGLIKMIGGKITDGLGNDFDYNDITSLNLPSGYLLSKIEINHEKLVSSSLDSYNFFGIDINRAETWLVKN